MTLAPLVSALRYRFYLHDHYGREALGIERPAETIEEAIRKIGAELQLSKTPDIDARSYTVRLNTQTRSGFDTTITRWENEISLALATLSTSPEFSTAVSDIDARLQAVDRGYKRKTPNPDVADEWFDHFDLQIAHLAALTSIDADLRQLQVAAVPKESKKSYLPFLIAAALVLVIAGGGYGLFRLLSRNDAAVSAPSLPPVAQQPAVPATPAAPTAATPPADDSPRVVRTVPVDVPAAPVAAPVQSAQIDPACRNFGLEVVSDGAYLADEPGGGRALAKLDPAEKLVLRRVVAGPAGRRIVEVEVPGRALRGYLGEADVRLPIMQWTCDQ